MEVRLVILTDLREMKRIRERYEPPYANKLENLDEMQKILKTQKSPQLMRKERANLSEYRKSKDSVIKIHPKKKGPRTRWLHW